MALIPTHGQVLNGLFTPPSGQTLLIVGQDTGTIPNYAVSVGSFGGFSQYAAVETGDQGINTQTCYGVGCQFAESLHSDYPCAAVEVGYQISGGNTDLVAITNGSYDSNINQVLSELQAYGVPIFLRFGYEFDATWNNYSAADYVPAWQHVWNLVHNGGYTNIAMVWHASTYCGGNGTLLSDYYPGDQYVDWMGLSYFEPVMCGYGQLLLQQDSQMNDLIEFDTGSGQHNKPIMICESSPQNFNITNLTCSENLSGNPLTSVTASQIWGSASAGMTVQQYGFGWFQTYLDFIHYESNIIRAVCYINANWAGFNGSGYWGDAEVQNNATILANWKNEVYPSPTPGVTPFWLTSGACTVLQAPCVVNGNTCTFTPTMTATPTFTPNANCGVVLANFNDQTAINNWLGNSGVASGSGSVSLNYSAPGYSGSPGDYSLEWIYNVPSGSWTAFWEYTSATATNEGLGFGAIDLTPYSQISFNIKGSAAGNALYYVEIGSNQVYSGVNDANWEAPVTVTGTSWMGVTLNLTAPPFVNPGLVNTGSFTNNLKNATQIVFAPQSTSGSPVTLWIDNIDFYLASCQTATSTPLGATNTPTQTSTNTATSTATNTATHTVTNTSTATVTQTATNTATQTPTNTATNTATLAGATSTFTNTDTNTVTQTATNTVTNTATLTPAVTSTFTNTATNTATQTSTNTATNTITGTIPATDTFTNTPTNTSTSTMTNTATNTLTPTVTNSATQTPTSTPPTALVTQGPASPSNSTQLPGTSNVQVLQVVISNPSGSSITTTGLTLADSGTGNTSGITGMTLVKNGANLSTTTLSGSTGTFSFSDPIPASSSVTYLITANFSAGALGTYTLALTGAAGTEGQAINYSGLPITEATVTVSEATSTATMTSTCTVTNTPVFTSTSTMTATNTATNSVTSTFTPQPTSTFTNTRTITSTDTPTVTSTSTIPLEPLISPPFPNPSNGQPISFDIQVPAPSTVTIDIFTVAFRKIAEQTTQISGSQTLQWNLKDISGIQVADGLYYVRIHVTGIQSTTKILKVLILR